MNMIDKQVKIGDKVEILTQEKSCHYLKKGSIVEVVGVEDTYIKVMGMTYKDKECLEETSVREQTIYDSDYKLITTGLDFSKPVYTKSGKPVEIITTEGRDVDYPVLAYIGDNTHTTKYTNDGKLYTGLDYNGDLTNKAMEKVVYVNLWSNGDVGYRHFATRKEADDVAEKFLKDNHECKDKRVGVSKVVLTLGKFDE